MTSVRSVTLITGDISEGAFGNVAGALATGFSDLGIKVEVAFLKGRRHQDDLRWPAETKLVKLSANRSLFSTWSIGRYLRSRRPDVAISLGWLQNVTASLAQILFRWPGKLVLSEHGHMSYEASVEHGHRFLFRNMPAAARLLYPKADGLVAVDEEILQDLIERVGVNTKRLPTTTIPNAIDLDRVRRLAAVSSSHPWLGDKSAPLFVSLGRLAPQKNHSLLIDAFEQIEEKHGARLLLVGDGPLRPDLTERIMRLRLDHAIQIVGHQPNPYPFLAGADVFVLPSLKEGWPLSLIEALACGCACIATTCSSGPVKILEEGRSGVLVPPGDPSALTTSMTDLLLDPARRASLSALGRTRALSFSPRAIALQWLDYLTALGSDAGATPG